MIILQIYFFYLLISVSWTFNLKGLFSLIQFNQYFNSLNSRFNKTKFVTSLGNYLFPSNQSQILDSILIYFNQTVDESSVKSYLVSLTENNQQPIYKDLKKVSESTLSQLSFNIMKYFDINSKWRFQYIRKICWEFFWTYRKWTDWERRSSTINQSMDSTNNISWFSGLRPSNKITEKIWTVQRWKIPNGCLLFNDTLSNRYLWQRNGRSAIYVDKFINTSKSSKRIKQCLDNNLDSKVKLLRSQVLEKNEDPNYAPALRAFQIYTSRFQWIISFFLALVSSRYFGKYHNIFFDPQLMSRYLRKIDIYKGKS